MSMERHTLIFRMCIVAVLKGAFGLSEQYINSIVGDKTFLPCKNIQGNIIIQWLRLNENTKTVDSTFTTTYTDGWTVNTNLPHHERLRVVGIEGGEKYTLEISNLTIEDSGRYSCAVDNQNGTQYSYVTLKVEDVRSDTYFTTANYKDTSKALTFSFSTSTASDIITTSSSTKTTVDRLTDTPVNHDSRVVFMRRCLVLEDLTFAKGYSSFCLGFTEEKNDSITKDQILSTTNNRAGPSFLQTYLIITSASIVIVFIGVASFVLYQNQKRYIAAIQNQLHHRENDRRPTVDCSLVRESEQNESNHETIPKGQYFEKSSHSDVFSRSQIDIRLSTTSIVNTEVKTIKSSYQPEPVQNTTDLLFLDNSSSRMNTVMMNQYEQLTDNWSNCSPVYQQSVESSIEIELENIKVDTSPHIYDECDSSVPHSGVEQPLATGCTGSDQRYL